MSIDDISRSVTKLRILKKIKKSVRLINCIKGKKSLGFFLMFVVASTITQESNSQNSCDSGKTMGENNAQLLAK